MDALFGELVEPVLAPVRRIVPPIGGLDMAFLVVISCLINFVIVRDLEPGRLQRVLLLVRRREHKTGNPHRTEIAANVRNFCIIAHIDHGKTTLSDRLLELTETVAMRDMEDQALDAMDLERERGITIRMHPVTLNYKARDGRDLPAQSHRYARARRLLI